MTEQTPATTATPTTEVEHFAAVPVESADPARRTITGIVVPYNENGVPRQNVVRMFRRGSLTIPPQIGRIKLYREHRRADGSGEVVGHAIGFEETDDALRMTFRVVDGPEGDRALAEASTVRDGLSIEARNATNTGRLVTSADLEAVALVPIPAFDNARVETVVANRPAQQENTMTDTTVTTAPQIDAGAIADALAARLDFASAPRPVAPAPAPLTITRAAELVHAVRGGTLGDADIAAALADITRSANPFVSPDGWVGELWDGVRYQREIVPLLSSRPLTHYNYKGWRWTAKPQVNDYTGDKTEIPTNAVTTAPVSGEAKRLAGGHDIDRKFWDFKDTDAITSYWDALTESYAIESDERAATFVKTSAKTTGLDGVTAIPAQADLLRAAAYGAALVKRGTRADATYFLVHPDDALDLLDITQLEVPEYLTLFGVSPERFTVTDLATAGRVIVGAKAAATWFELPGSPIRVETVNLANGGRDAAVFGYYGSLLHNANGIVSVPIA